MTTAPATSNSTRLTGALSGTGHDILRATVITDPVPVHPPTELAGAVHPLYDRTGELGDWSAGSLQPGHHFDDGDWTRFREWRATFAQDRVLGELALIRAFLDWLEPRSDTSALGVLRLASGRIDFHTALKMKVQIEAADRAVSAADQDGLGLYTATGTKSAMRVLIPASPTTLLLGLNDTTLTVGADGLSLQAPGSPTQLHAISGWRVSDSGQRSTTSTATTGC